MAIGSLVAPLRAAEEIDWGTWNVVVNESSPSIPLGVGWADVRAGISRWSKIIEGQDTAMMDYRMGWTNKGDEGLGIVGLLEDEIAVDDRVEVKRYGRRGSEIQLIFIVHRKGATTVHPPMKKVMFAATFPEDLPPGDYAIVVESRDEVGTLRVKHERKLVRPAAATNALEGLNDVQLLQEYVKRGEALKGRSIEPIDYRFGRLAAASPYQHPDRVAWVDVHREIVRRGARMVSGLMELLETEAARNPPGEADKFGMAVDVMMMLWQIGDPRPVELLSRIARGMDGRANLSVRDEAIAAMETLTHVTFRVEPQSPTTYLAMMHEKAVRIDRYATPRRGDEQVINAAAGLYADWLVNEGRDPTQWFALARGRARTALEGNDLVCVCSAIAFLTGSSHGRGLDDSPTLTLPALGKISAREGLSSMDRIFLQLDKGIASYGPAARPYVGCLIDAAKASPTWSAYDNLVAVGGEQAMACMVSELPKLSDAVTKFGIDLSADEMTVSKTGGRGAILSYRACRWGIERWAGRTFATDIDIAKWWDKDCGKTQGEWLESNMRRTAVEADAGNPEAQFILRAIVPDLAHAEADRRFDPPWRRRGSSAKYYEKSPKIFRQKWVEENADRLEFDAGRSCFVLRKT